MIKGIEKLGAKLHEKYKVEFGIYYDDDGDRYLFKSKYEEKFLKSPTLKEMKKELESLLKELQDIKYEHFMEAFK